MSVQGTGSVGASQPIDSPAEPERATPTEAQPQDASYGAHFDSSLPQGEAPPMDPAAAALAAQLSGPAGTPQPPAEAAGLFDYLGDVFNSDGLDGLFRLTLDIFHGPEGHQKDQIAVDGLMTQLEGNLTNEREVIASHESALATAPAGPEADRHAAALTAAQGRESALLEAHSVVSAAKFTIDGVNAGIEEAQRTGTEADFMVAGLKTNSARQRAQEAYDTWLASGSQESYVEHEMPSTENVAPTAPVQTGEATLQEATAAVDGMQPHLEANIALEREVIARHEQALAADPEGPNASYHTDALAAAQEREAAVLQANGVIDQASIELAALNQEAVVTQSTNTPEDRERMNTEAGAVLERAQGAYDTWLASGGQESYQRYEGAGANPLDGEDAVQAPIDLTLDQLKTGFQAAWNDDKLDGVVNFLGRVATVMFDRKATIHQIR